MVWNDYPPLPITSIIDHSLTSTARSGRRLSSFLCWIHLMSLSMDLHPVRESPLNCILPPCDNAGGTAWLDGYTFLRAGGSRQIINRPSSSGTRPCSCTAVRGRDEFCGRPSELAGSRWRGEWRVSGTHRGLSASWTIWWWALRIWSSSRGYTKTMQYLLYRKVTKVRIVMISLNALCSKRTTWSLLFLFVERVMVGGGHTKRLEWAVQYKITIHLERLESRVQTKCISVRIISWPILYALLHNASHNVRKWQCINLMHADLL